MKTFIIFAAILALAFANSAEILKSESDVGPVNYTLDVGTSKEGVVKDVGNIVYGSFQYKDEKDGKVYSVSYVAVKRDFQPVGEHLPPLPKN